MYLPSHFEESCTEVLHQLIHDHPFGMIEIPITKLSGKWKLSQNRSEADRDGVKHGLRATDNCDAAAMASAMSSLPG
jgi:predicted FMN-binding regulatory protein PaiB